MGQISEKERLLCSTVDHTKTRGVGRSCIQEVNLTMTQERPLYELKVAKTQDEIESCYQMRIEGEPERCQRGP